MWSFGLENGYVVFQTTTGKMFTDQSCEWRMRGMRRSGAWRNVEAHRSHD